MKFIDRLTRRRDEQTLEYAITIRKVVELMNENDEPTVSHNLRGIEDTAWAEVLEIPRWRRAGVTPETAEQHLQASRAGVIYTDSGEPVLPRSTRRLLRRAGIEQSR